MEHANRKRLAGAVWVVAVLALWLSGGGSNTMDAVSHAAGAAPCTVLAAPSLQLAGLRLSLKIECDTPSGCALARTLRPVVVSFTSGTFTSGNGE